MSKKNKKETSKRQLHCSNEKKDCTYYGTRYRYGNKDFNSILDHRNRKNGMVPSIKSKTVFSNRFIF